MNTSELAREADVPRHYIEHWEREGVLLADHRTGRAIFNDREATIARVMVPITKLRIVAPIMKSIAGAIRSALKPQPLGEGGWAAHKNLGLILDAAKSGKPAWLFILPYQGTNLQPRAEARGTTDIVRDLPGIISTNALTMIVDLRAALATEDVPAPKPGTIDAAPDWDSMKDFDKGE